MENKITLDRGKAKQLIEQTERKCDNCRFYETAECPVEVAEIDEDIPECGEDCFEQKQITLVFENGQFKIRDNITPLQYVDRTALPKVGEEIELVCGECGGDGIYLNDIEQPIDCEDCGGKGSWRVKIKASVKFSIVDGNFKQVIRLGKDRLIGDDSLEKIESMKLNDGDYVLLEVLPCK